MSEGGGVPGRVTRGNGFLEALLARKRAALADGLIPDRLRRGRILDVGCGSSPYFLLHTQFGERFGVDQLSAAAASHRGITMAGFEICSGCRLPFADGFFDTVTVLAVLEHLELEAAVRICSESHRVLRPGGLLVGTTPASWADAVLKGMARLGLVSREEIDEHKTLFTRDKLRAVLGQAGFDSGEIATGCFEMGMNLWFSAEKV